MNKIFYLVLFNLIILNINKTTAQTLHSDSLEKGVSVSLAKKRSGMISELVYELEFKIPSSKQQSIQAEEHLTFDCKGNSEPLILDFKENPDHILSLIVNWKNSPIVFKNEHIVIEPAQLSHGHNKIDIKFIAGDLSLNRNNDFLYTLLVPDRARTVFPCFDQPDLKANFQLTLQIPQEWVAVTNAPLIDSVLQENSKALHFGLSDKISTYLFSFVAGKFDRVSRIVDGRSMTFYHRETDTAKINSSLDPVFQIQGNAISFMQDYTQISYPFKKFDFIALPDFQYGGMEHVGAIQYKASSLFLDNGATKEEKISRSNLLSHETAHMWFGDLVTMNWFNDVWMKEVFANFMADKITRVALANTNYDLKFLLDHFPAAYSVDRTAGANPIRQELTNLQDAGSLYGNIIYHKAPIMMRQLERLMGEEAFRNGLRIYLKKYEFGNATWPDLINILDAYTPADLQAWNQVWVNEPGRPVFDYAMKLKGNTIDQLEIIQNAEDGSDRIWPQLFEIALVYQDKIEQFTVRMEKRSEQINLVKGKKTPLFILFNSTGQGYGLFPTDTMMVKNIVKLKNPVMRASAYINLYENMLNGRYVKPGILLDQYLMALKQEKEELNLRLMTVQLSDIFWKLTVPSDREKIASAIENVLWNVMLKETTSGNRKTIFKAFQNIALSRQAQDSLYAIWKTQKPPAGIILSEEDYTSLAFSLAVRDYPVKDIISQQLKRIQNKDRRERLNFLIPALSSDVQVRDSFFNSLRDEKNREKEAWVVTALQYLHHPLRASTSINYLKESLDLLQEIQLTGDIFFPQSWLQATFGMYQSPEAAQIATNFLKEHPDYNPKLKAKILQAIDGVLRAQKLIYNNAITSHQKEF